MTRNLSIKASRFARTFLVTMLLSNSAAFAQNQCATGAALENPAAARSGLGEWFRALLEKIEAPRKEETTARPGIGGTGIDNGGMGGTGIVGVITGFASVCVNGVEVHFDRDTPVLTDGERTTVRELAIGQIVAVRAQGEGDEVAAQRIAVMHAAVGPVSSVDVQAGTLVALGQQVRAVYPRELAGLKPGAWVQISGLRNAAGDLSATRIAAIAPKAQVQLSGWAQSDGAGGLRLQGARVDLGNLKDSGTAQAGDEVTVRGQWDGATLRAESLEVEPTRAQLGRVDRVVLEGLVHGTQGQEYRVGGRTLTLGAKLQISGNPDRAFTVNQRVRITGSIGSDKRVTVNRIEVRSESDRRGRGQSGTQDDRRGRTRGSDDDGGGDDSSSGSSASGSDDGGKSGSSKSGSDSDSGSRSGSSGSSGSGGSGSGSGKGK